MAARPAPVPLRLLVQLQPGQSPVAWGSEASISPLSKRAQIYQLTFPDSVAWQRAQRRIWNDPAVRNWQFDYPVEFRRQPNDTFYDRQPNLERMGFPTVWEDQTGGRTVAGDEIVIAILDEGFYASHPDLQANLWENPAEIPGDGIDNDANGFIDDQYGWDFPNNDPNVPDRVHGTAVAGIIGARGNNGIGISGTNWDTRLMLLAILEVSDIIAAYDYVIEQRRRWRTSGGSRGAFVVATNASFGIEGQFCANYPLWGQMYDRLGEEGILTAASTANRAWDVDEWGDMPATCPSDFIIGVTNLGENDRLWRSAAWGRQSVDLGAAGEGSYSTSSGTFGYAAFGNTSAAAPYVAGAIGLLYATPCQRLLELARTDPPSAARLVRRSVLRSVRPLEAIELYTSSGGILDVAEARRHLSDLCMASEVANLTLSRIYPNPTRSFFQLEFGDSSLGPYRVEIIDAAGRILRAQHLSEDAAFPVSNRIDLVGIPAGVYVIRLSNRQESVYGKVVVQ